MTRWQLTGLGLVVVASVTVAGVALATAGAARTVDPTATSETATTDAAATPQPAAPRAVPADTPAPVAVDPAVQAQLDYVLTHWQRGTYNTSEYGEVSENDCVNFASQSLIERGWQMDDTWRNPKTGSAYDASAAWVSSTALMTYLGDSGKAAALTDDQRDQVKVGDVVQFDWDNSGDRDHTGIVTRVEGAGADIVISFAGHTLDSDYRSVDTAITVDHPGGTAYYWSIP